ncbi:MAG: CDP-alcohol phosphatidyltransferase family protein [archaeon]|nr:CDP-alcohol phosphatidyltransferase family protein [archaeon]
MKKKKLRNLRKNVKRVKNEIKDEVFLNVPNTLTMSRILFAFIAIYMLFSGFSRWWVAIVFAIGAITDFFDGFFARKLKQTTTVGARLDQVIDRVFTVIIVFALVFYFIKYDQKGILSLLLISSREIIGLPGFLIRIIRQKDAYKVKYIGKITTFVQSVAIGLIIVGFSWSVYFAVATCLVGILAGFDYLKDSLN